MITALLASGVFATSPPIIIDDRAEFPWVVAAQAGGRCGVVRAAQGARPIAHGELIARLGVVQPAASGGAFASVLPLVPTPGLFGVEGAALVALAEALQRRLGLAGVVALEVDANGARLRWQVPIGSRIAVDDDDALAAIRAGTAMVAEQDADVGRRALRHSLSYSCFGVPADELPPDVAVLRARLAGITR